jgi:hypothetical protein
MITEEAVTCGYSGHSLRMTEGMLVVGNGTDHDYVFYVFHHHRARS